MEKNLGSSCFFFQTSENFMDFFKHMGISGNFLQKVGLKLYNESRKLIEN